MLLVPQKLTGKVAAEILTSTAINLAMDFGAGFIPASSLVQTSVTVGGSALAAGLIGHFVFSGNLLESGIFAATSAASAAVMLGADNLLGDDLTALENIEADIEAII